MIRILDTTLTEIGVIDDFESLITNESWKECSTFTLDLLYTEEHFRLLKQNHLIYVDSDLEDVEAYYIEHISFKTENGILKMHCEGRNALSLLERRISISYLKYTNTACMPIALRMLSENIADATDPYRKISNVDYVYVTTGQPIAYEVNKGDNCLDVFTDLTGSNDFGYTFYFNRKTKIFTLRLYESIDKTNNIIFSAQFNNVISDEYIKDNSGEKTMCYVLNNDGAIIDTLHSYIVGAARREVAISNGDENPTIDYLDGLAQDELNKNINQESYEATIDAKKFKFRKDYQLGYKVLIKNDELGLVLRTPVIGVETTYTGFTVEEKPSFGDKIPTIIDKIKKNKGR